MQGTNEPCFFTSRISDCTIQLESSKMDDSIPDDLLELLLTTKSDHSNCHVESHDEKSRIIRLLIQRVFMTSIMKCTESGGDPSALLHFLLKGHGTKLLQVLLKFNTKILSCTNELNSLLCGILKLRKTPELRMYDIESYYALCSVCVELLHNMCLAESLTEKTGMIREVLTELQVYLPSLMLERTECDAQHRSLVSRLISQTLLSFNFCATALKATSAVEECQYVPILDEIVEVYINILKLESHGCELDVPFAAFKGLLQVLQCVLPRLHTINQTLLLCTEVIRIIDKHLIFIIKCLVEVNDYRKVSELIDHLFSFTKIVKECKARYMHHETCQKKKHRHCHTKELLHHHSPVFMISLPTNQSSCLISYFTTLVFKIYHVLLIDDIHRHAILRYVQEAFVCCCMKLSDLVKIIFEDFSSSNSISQQLIMSSLCSVILVQLSGGVAESPVDCTICGTSWANSAGQDLDVSTFLPLLATSPQTPLILEHLVALSRKANKKLVYSLYRYIFKPYLDESFSQNKGLSIPSAYYCLSSLCHSLSSSVDCMDHFLASAHSMLMLEYFAKKDCQLHYAVLKVLGLVVKLRCEDVNLNAMFNLMLGEPEILTDAEHIEFVYEIPNLEGETSDDHILLLTEKWRNYEDLLVCSAPFRTDFASRNGVRHLQKWLSVLTVLLLSSEFSDLNRRKFLYLLYRKVLMCCLTCAHYALSIGKESYSIKMVYDQVLAEANGVLTTKACNPESISRLITVLLECSMSKTAAIQQVLWDNRYGYPSEEGELVREGSPLSTSSSALTDNYEADSESCDLSPPEDPDYVTLIVPEIWLLAVKLLTASSVSFDQVQLMNILKLLVNLVNSSGIWKFSQEKTELCLMLLKHFQKEIMDEHSPIGERIILLAEDMLKQSISSSLLFELITVVKLSNLKNHLLESLHRIIKSASMTPSHSISYPLSRSSKTNGCLIMSVVDLIHHLDLSAVVWIYMDGGISTAYGSAYKRSQPVDILRISSPKVAVVLQSEVSNGNACLCFLNEFNEVIGSFTARSVLTTNKWQMISFSVHVRSREFHKLSADYSLGVDGSEKISGHEPLASSSLLLDNNKGLVVQIGQRSNKFVREHCVHVSNVLLFRGNVSKNNFAKLYSYGPQADLLLTSAIGYALSSTALRRSMLRQHQPKTLKLVMESFDEEMQKDSIRGQILTIIGPKYKPYSLMYVKPTETPSRIDKLLSTLKMRDDGGDYHDMIRIRPVAYDGLVATDSHVQLDESMNCLGGINVLLFLFAKSLEIGQPEESQNLALDGLLHANQLIIPSETNKGLDYSLLAKLLRTKNCQLNPAMTAILLGYATQCIDSDYLLVDLLLMEQVLLDWRIWESRSSWLIVWEALVQAVSEKNKYRTENSKALLKSDIIQKIIRIPLEQLHEDSKNAVSCTIIRHIAMVTYQVLSVSYDKRLMADINKCLLQLHPAASTYIQYDRNMLYSSQRFAPNRRKRNAEFKSQKSLSSELVYIIEDFDENKVSQDFRDGGNTSEDCGLSGFSTSSNLNDDVDGSSSSSQMKASEIPPPLSRRQRPLSPVLDIDKINTPDIILCHDDAGLENEQNQPNKAEDSISILSAQLLNVLFLVTDSLSPTDQRIFCSDLMTFAFEALTVFLNHEDVTVIYTSLKLLYRVVCMADDQQLESFINRKGFHLVASQLHQMPSSDKFIQICLKLINSKRYSLLFDKREELAHALLLPLIGCLDQCCHCTRLSSLAFSNLFKVINERCGALVFCVNNGLIEVLTNCLFSINKSFQSADSSELDRVLALMQSCLQKIVQVLVSTNQTGVLENMMTRFVLLERWQRHQVSVKAAGFPTVSRLEGTISILFQELYSCVKAEAHAIQITKLRQLIQRAKSKETPGGLEDSGMFQTRRDSFGGSLTSLSSIQPTENKVNQASLHQLLSYTVQEYCRYAMYRASVCKGDTGILPSLVELLLDCLTVQESSSGSFWRSLSASVRETIWQTLTSILSFVMSSFCDLATADATLTVLSNLPESTQKDIINSLTADMYLLPTIKAFLSNNTLKTNNESFVIKIIRKQSVSSNVVPLTDNLKKENIAAALAESVKKHEAKRREWKEILASKLNSVVYCPEGLMKEMTNSAMEINKLVVHGQNLERKKFIEHRKIQIAAEISITDHWKSLIDQLTHERAVWHDLQTYPQSWKVDPTEGPGRVRRRLERCHLDGIPSKFMLDEAKYKVKLAESCQPLKFLFADDSQSESASSALIYRLYTNETITFTCKCSNVTPSMETRGDLLISNKAVHFVGDDAVSDVGVSEVLAGGHDLLSVSWPLVDIQVFFPRRYQLQDNAIEIFLTTGRSCFLAFVNESERDVFLEELKKLELPSLKFSIDQGLIVMQWQRGQLNNFDYLTHLNTLAGRSFNDLMQYPVFPFILSDYESTHLDLTNTKSYRLLNKPIACQKPENEAKYKVHYQAIAADIELAKRNPEKHGPTPLSPYHYASHYSNSGVVLHYLLRLLPYTKMFLKYQDGQFDIPDRTFHSMQTSWLLSSEKSSTDVKELIPEFFYLPEFFSNSEGFNFGRRHSGDLVMDVTLPAWCKQDPRLFVLILRQALESHYVTKNLHLWINLVFGYQQQGQAAEEAVNKFHPATYFGLAVNSIKDEIQRNAIKAMIRTYGQMPKQLFTDRHPEQIMYSGKSLDQTSKELVPVLESVTGLKWGTYLGSPSELTEPKVVMNDSNEEKQVTQIVAVATGEIIGLGRSSCFITHATKSNWEEVMPNIDKIWAAMLSWNHIDGMIRIRDKKNGLPLSFMYVPFKIAVCSGVPECGLLFIASDAGFIQVHRIESPEKLGELSWLGLAVTLNGHQVSVTCLHISTEYSILVSADASGLAIIWDLNKLTYIRSIQNSTFSKIDCVTVSPTLGDIALSSSHGNGSAIELFTINAHPVSSLTVTDRVSCLCYSSAPEGLAVNVIAGALSNGAIQLWSSWDLKPVRTLSVPGMVEPFISCTYTADNNRLAACTCSGRVIIWERPSLSTQQPANKFRFITFQEVELPNII